MPTRAPSYRPIKGNRPLHNPCPIERISGSAGMTRRARLRRHNPLCVMCLEIGVTREVYEFDHVVPLWKGGVDHESNMQGLCRDHHEEKTKAEAAERARTGRPPIRGRFDSGFA